MTETEKDARIMELERLLDCEKERYEILKGTINPELGDDCFSEEWAVIRLLADDRLFVNSRRFLDLEQFGSKEREETLVLFLICNDTFYWACADCEPVTSDELRGLYAEHVADESWGTTKWVCRKRKLRPQTPIVKMMRASGAWTDELEALPAPEPS